MSSKHCPCCSGQLYQTCCEPAHLGKEAALTCEALMRSRYSAYVLQLTDYLVNTTHPNLRSKNLRQDIEASYPKTQWLGLSIEKTQNGEAQDKIGKVEFIARFEESGQQGQLHELSRFCRYQGKWVYMDGKIFDR